MKLYACTFWLFASISCREASGKSFLPEKSDIMMPPILSCPDPVPAEGSTCNSPFSCEVGEFCCPEDDTICVPEKSCYCDETTSLVVCYESFYPISCPSMCPTTRPETNDICSLESQFLCNYGNPLDCEDVDLKFDFERQCSCYNGTFSCYDNVCPVPCPATQPKDGDKCLPFAPGNCDYGSFCCPEEGGMCVPEKSCYCDGISSYCYDTFYSVPCPSMCPETPPNNMDMCDIDSRFQCNYGDAFTCDDDVAGIGTISFDFEKQCTCYNGTFSCYSNSCPIPCPAVQPMPGSICSPFVDYSCGYDEFCCPEADDDICVPMTECYCDSDLKSSCHEPPISCPSLCPETKPKDGDKCDIKERYMCRYNEGMCPTSECSCVQGVFVCNDLCYDIFETSGENSGLAQDPGISLPGDVVIVSAEARDESSNLRKKKDKKAIKTKVSKGTMKATKEKRAKASKEHNEKGKK